MEEPGWAPFIVKPHRINNYTHLIALLKVKQAKYKNYSPGVVNTSFAKVLGSSQETLNLDSVLEGFLHEKLKERSIEFETQLFADFNKAINSTIKDLKAENDHKIYASKIGPLKDIEQLFLAKPTQGTFKDDLLFDMYTFISQRSEPQAFLEESYLKYIIKFYSQSHPSDAGNIKGTTVDDKTLKTIVSEFVKMRFNGEEYKIETYESRYIWAEAFVFLRIGRVDLLNELLAEFEMFFEFMGQRFKTVFSAFLAGKRTSSAVNLRNDDRFKKFLFELADDEAKSDGLVINTAEDYIWLRLMTKKDFKKDIDVFESDKVKFMIAIFAKKYCKAINILLRSDFNVVPKFFLLRELCLEQNLDQSADEAYVNNVFDSSNSVPRSRLRTRMLLDESSSTMSLTSLPEQSSSISPIFLNFLFNIVVRMSTREFKVKLIEMLKNHSEYYEVIPDYIIKYDLFDILGSLSEKSPAVDFFLDSKISSRVLQRLRKMGDKAKIVQLCHIIDDVTMVQVLKEALEEAILIDGTLDQEIVEKYLKKNISKDWDELSTMYGFYRFFKQPTVANLRQTVLFDQTADLKPFRFVIERLFAKAVEVIRAENDKFMAKHLFRLCGALDLNEECASKISKDLVLLI